MTVIFKFTPGRTWNLIFSEVTKIQNLLLKLEQYDDNWFRHVKKNGYNKDNMKGIIITQETKWFSHVLGNTMKTWNRLW
jgi:hypothetical protein